MEGCLDGMFEGATFLMTFGIFFVFLIELIACGTKFWRTSEELNDLKTGMPGPGNTWPNWSCTTARDARSNRRWCSSNSRTRSRLSTTRPTHWSSSASSRFHRRPIGRRPWNNQQCEGRQPNGREPDPGHVNRALHDAGRRGPLTLADCQPSHAGLRYSEVDQHDHRTWSCPSTNLTNSTRTIRQGPSSETPSFWR